MMSVTLRNLSAAAEITDYLLMLTPLIVFGEDNDEREYCNCYQQARPENARRAGDIGPRSHLVL